MKALAVWPLLLLAVGPNGPAGPGGLAAAEYWISPSGSDAARGSRDEPFKTIQRGVNAAVPGDTVFVRAGRYEEHVKVPAAKSGEPQKWLTIAAAPGEQRQAIVGTEEPRIDVSGSDSSAFALQAARYVRIRGFRCVAPYRGRGSGIGARNCEHIEIVNCALSGGGQGGIDANQCNYVTIDGVEAFFNGGGTGWSSGISLLDLRSKENVVRNCTVYGNYDNSSYRTDGNGIIIDNAYTRGGALVANNLAFMNGGKGMCSTRSDDCVFLNNTSVANCWQVNQQETAHELSIRGARNVVRNNIAVGTLPKAAGMLVLLEYSGPGGNVKIDPGTIVGDHNLLFNSRDPVCAALAGNRLERFTLDQLRAKFPQWAGESLSVDPGFVDAENLDFRLRPDSPALALGCDRPGGHHRLAGQACGERRPLLAGLLRRRISVGCGGSSKAGRRDRGRGRRRGHPHPARKPIRPGLARDALGVGQAAPGGTAPSSRSRRPAEGRFSQPLGPFRAAGRAGPDRPPTPCPPRASAAGRLQRPGHESGDDQPKAPDPPGADAEEQAFVRRCLRACVWTQDEKGSTPFAELRPALSAALGLQIESDPPLPPDRKFTMVTLNMPLGPFLTDLARRMDLRFTLSRRDPLADAAKVQEVALDRPFGARTAWWS